MFFIPRLLLNKITIIVVILIILVFVLPESWAERVPLAPELRSATETSLDWTKEKFSQVFEISKRAFHAVYRWILIAGEFTKNTINGAYEATRGAVVGALEDAYEVFDKTRRVKDIIDE